MRSQLRNLTFSNNLRKNLLSFFLFGILVLIGITGYTEAQIAFTSDGLLEDNVLDWEPKIYVISTDGKRIEQLTYHDRGDWSPTWAPDGKQIAFTSERVAPVVLNQPPRILESYEIYVTNISGQNSLNLTQHPASDKYPTWSPDGKQIAFTSERNGNKEIYVMDADGSNLTRLTDHPRSDSHPTWSPDGTQIAFESILILRRDIFVMHADGTNVRQVTNTPETDIEPSWSPDGKKIAFASYRKENKVFDVYVINVNGTDERNLTDSKFEDRHPTWSPDGLQIAYSSRRAGLYGIYLMNADGRSSVPLIENLALAIEPAWSPKPLAVSPKEKLPTLWGALKSKP